MDISPLSHSLKELIFTGNVNNAIEEESKTNGYNYNDWDFYFKYDGFPSSFEYKSLKKKILNQLVDITERIIIDDMPYMSTLNNNDRTNANRIIKYIAKQQTGELSNINHANYLKTPLDTVNNILDFFRKNTCFISLRTLQRCC